MEQLLKLIRESMSEVVGGLIVAGVLALLAALYTVGAWAAVLVAVIVVFSIIGLWAVVSRQQRAGKITSVTSEPLLRETSSISSKPGSQKTVLVVDDDIEIFGATFIRVLKDAGFHTTAATTAAQAIQILESNQPIDLAIIDLIMPPGDDYKGRSSKIMGIRVIEALRKRRGNIPVICFSVVRDPKVLDRVRKLGVPALLQKPVRPSVLLEQTELLLARAESPSERELIREEIDRRKLELQSSYPSTRLRALWSLGQVGHYDPSTVTVLIEIAASDEDDEVKAAAKDAVRIIRRRLRKKDN